MFNMPVLRPAKAARGGCRFSHPVLGGETCTPPLAAFAGGRETPFPQSAGTNLTRGSFRNASEPLLKRLRDSLDFHQDTCHHPISWNRFPSLLHGGGVQVFCRRRKPPGGGGQVFIPKMGVRFLVFTGGCKPAPPPLAAFAGWENVVFLEEQNVSPLGRTCNPSGKTQGKPFQENRMVPFILAT